MKQLQIPLNEIKDGFARVTLTSYNQLIEYEEHLTKNLKCVFRGQKEPEWPLQARLFRQYPDISESEIDEMIVRYNQEMSLKLTDKDRILARGQHYGLWTQLLDFTRDIRVALYFAYEEATIPDPKKFVSVWALYGEYKLTQFAPSLRAANPSLPQLVEYLEVNDTENRRLVNQKGLFVKCPFGFRGDLKNWCAQYVQAYYGDAPSPAMLLQFLVPLSDRTACLSALAMDLIKPQLLFPEDDGIIKMINLSRVVKAYLT